MDVHAASKLQEFCCQLCCFSSPSVERVREHLVSQHAVQGAWLCPLCQAELRGREGLTDHLRNGHSVVPSCLERLLLAAVKVDAQISTRTVRHTLSHNSDVTDSQTETQTERPRPPAPKPGEPLSPQP
ncbi:hypothetical protein AOXY_G30669 [Acipenser oxyrinchus oxyrinchus]|uniref:C2H2-type domain-containing protein n=1 Tax=Acipenser oxyrinchus oxyrinchus TaxID=40147 RepID=A0AAD8FRG6_ACIOX|nr:hypothetical protein AOXY_G30669 [Acipenser oxyrinchus oxyrinchus]